MLVIISPAKTLDFDTPPTTKKHSMPGFLKESKQLIGTLRDLAPPDVSNLMHISTKLGELNADRYAAWQPKFTPANAKPAALAFKGDVYMGLDAANEFSERDFTWSQKHVRILSGLYGLLKPLDLIQPYRLEMGTRLKINGHADLYEFWGNKLTNALNRAVAEQNQQVLINLASKEYYHAVDPARISARIITPTFLDEKNGQYKFLSFYAKKARGLMTRFIVKNRVSTLKALKAFDLEGYRYCPRRSEGDDWVFIRDQ